MNATERLLTVKIGAVMQMTSLSRAQIYAMERTGDFPTRIMIMPTKGAWATASVYKWMQARIDAQRPLIVTISPSDRFISKRQVMRLASLGPTSIANLEQAGQLPARISITKGRVAWLEREILQWSSHRPKKRMLPIAKSERAADFERHDRS